MSLSGSHFLALGLLFLGELLAVGAEMIAARSYGASQSFSPVLPVVLVMMIAGSIFLIAGYMLGYTAFRNIWIVSAISITSILIVEPLLAYDLFQQLPTKGALVGFVAGIIGFAAALSW